VWILVNDGSPDDTDKKARELLRISQIPMMYIQKENGGKHSAFKVALENCETEFFQCMDDDDVYFPEAVDFFLGKWKEIKSQGKWEVGAIRTLTLNQDGTYRTKFDVTKELGREFDMTTLEMNYVQNKRMENWTCYDTEKLRSVDLFPKDYWLHDRHKFFLESIWQGRFARKYKCRYVYLALREYNDQETQSLTRGKKNEQRCMDTFINSHLVLNEQYDYIRRDKKQLLRRVISTGRVRLDAHISLISQLAHCQNAGIKLLLILFYPISFMNKLTH